MSLFTRVTSAHNVVSVAVTACCACFCVRLCARCYVSIRHLHAGKMANHNLANVFRC